MKISVCRFVISAMVLIIGAMELANAQQCSSSITMCGCTITSPGVYTVDADLNADQGLTSRGGCIDVAAKRVKLITNGFPILGANTGTGIGIHLLSSADDVFLEGALLNPVYSFFSYTSLAYWQYGLESEASNVIADGFYYLGNTTGVLLNEAHNNTIGNFNSLASVNLVYGVWIKGGSGNQVSIRAGDNGVAGIYLGCSSTGPLGQACKEEEETSNGNFIYSNFSVGQHYGIAVERGSKRNIITDNSTGSNGNNTYDLFDGNPNCDSNLWRVNLFTTANQSCIH